MLQLGKMARAEARAGVKGESTALTALGVAMAAASGLHDGISSLRFHFDPRRGAGDTPTPRCFCKRVWNCLKTKELRFWRVQKSLEECEKKGDRTKHVGRFEGLNVGRLRKKEVSNSK